MKKKQNSMHYAWKIMIACIFLKLGNGGAITAITGNFVTPIVRDLGCQVSQFTMIVSIEAISMAFFYTAAAKILTTKRIGLVMGLASIAEVVGIALMSFYSSVHMFYISGVIIGVAQAFTGLVAVPILINMWFHKKAGTVLGIVVAVNGAATVGYGLLSAQLIVHFGWRTAYLILAGMAFLFTVPAVFCLVKSPAEAGCQPYGAEDAPPAGSNSPNAGASSTWGLSRRAAFRSPALYFAWIACLCYSIGSGVSGYVSTFSTMEVGQTITFGAQAGMLLNIGWIACSIILGRINDKFGVKAGLLWGAVFTAIGYSTMLYGIQRPALILPAAFAVGLGNSMYQVQCPLLVRTVVGEREYSSIWSIMMVANSLIGGGLYSSIGLIYDKTGSYYGAFIMACALYIGALVIGSAAVSAGQRLRAKAS
ncbi:MAG: MFS transporter [Oscillospiraceae bacterium]|nr:MFS transporter [Oscillospiraceae bacterium]